MYAQPLLVRSVVLHSVDDMGRNSVISRNIYSTCKLFGLSSGDFLNHKVLVVLFGNSPFTHLCKPHPPRHRIDSVVVSAILVNSR